MVTYHYFPRESLVRFLFSLLFILSLGTTAKANSSQMDSDIILSVTNGWEMLIDSRPMKSISSGEILNQSDELSWVTVDSLSAVAGRIEDKKIWFRVPLPSLSEWRDPALFINESFQQFEIFSDKGKIYRFGDPYSEDQINMSGSEWHIIPLSPDLRSDYLYFYICSANVFKNMMEEVIVGNRVDIVKYLVSAEMDKVAIASVMVVIGLIALFLYYRNRSLRLFLTIGFLAILSGVVTVSNSQIKTLILDSPLLWLTGLNLGATLALIINGVLIEQLFGKGPFKIVRRSWQLWIVYLLWTLYLFGTLQWEAWNEVFYFIISSLTLVFWSVLIVQKMFVKNIEARIFLFGFSFRVFFELQYHFRILTGQSSNPEDISHWADLFFIIVLLVIVSRRIKGLYKEVQLASAKLEETNNQLKHEITERKQAEKILEDYKGQLEELVEKRTHQLSESNQQLKAEIVEREQAENERIELERQLHQSQKLEAVGTLAGGIAHEFNNILSTILGFTKLVLDDQKEGSPEQLYLEETQKAGKRAANLVEQIQLFSQSERQVMKAVSISTLVRQTLNLLRATLPSTIDIQQKIQEDCRLIKADLSQIHHVIVNLCTNAAHAMQEQGGKLSVDLEEIDFSTTKKPLAELRDTAYLKLTISDTGAGILPEIKDRIFDPFFSTKDIGKGSGLGLSVVHGIVKSHQGMINVESNLGKGSTFCLYFPVIQEDTGKKHSSTTTLPMGNERILIVEDEKSLAKMYEISLQKLGYSVTTTNNPKEALRVFEDAPNEFDLVFTDQTMPHMTGIQLSSLLLEHRPDLPIILATGHNNIKSTHEVEETGIKRFLIKPVNLAVLSDSIRQVLA